MLWTIPAACLSLAALSPQPASAITTPVVGLDSTNNGSNPIQAVNASNNVNITNGNRLMRTFTMGPRDSLLTDINLGLNINGISGVTRDLEISAFKVTLNSSNVWEPFGAAVGSMVRRATSAGLNVPFYDTFSTADSAPSTTNTLVSTVFQAGQNYGIQFRNTSASTLNLRRCAPTTTTPPVTFPCNAWPIAAYGGVVYLDGSSSGDGTIWTDLSEQQQSTYMQLNFTPVPVVPSVPAPALMGFSSLSGLMVYSRRLRSRIKNLVS